MADEEPKIHIDADWKAQAQAEKERLVEAEAAQAQEQPGRRRSGELPDADFRTLVGVLASQAVMGLGAVADPKTGRVVIDLPGARFAIDLLAVLEEKTKGNLGDEETRELTQTLEELRARFIEISKLVAEQSAGSAPQTGESGARGAANP